MFSMMFHRLMWTSFVYYILASRLFLSLSVNLTSHFSNLLILDNYRYQTHERNIPKFYLLTPKHLIIQLTNLQIDIMNLSTNFPHCRKNSDYFWTRVYITISKLFAWPQTSDTTWSGRNCLKAFLGDLYLSPWFLTSFLMTYIIS